MKPISFISASSSNALPLWKRRRYEKIVIPVLDSLSCRPEGNLSIDWLAKTADVIASHVPVREAFRRLESQGLVVSEPRRGVRVAGFSLEEVREIAEMRAALEVLALRNAVPHLTKAILDQAEEANRAGDCAHDVHAWEEANRTFHRILLMPCGMPCLLKAIDDLHTASARFLFSGGR